MCGIRVQVLVTMNAVHSRLSRWPHPRTKSLHPADDFSLTRLIIRWCPSIAWTKGLRSVVSRLLIEPVAKVRGHTIAQQFLHGPHMVCQTCRHSRCD